MWRTQKPCGPSRSYSQKTDKMCRSIVQLLFYFYCSIDQGGSSRRCGSHRSRVGLQDPTARRQTICIDLLFSYCFISIVLLTRVVRAGDVAHTEAVWAFKILQPEDRQYVLIYCSAIVLFLLFY